MMGCACAWEANIKPFGHLRAYPPAHTHTRAECGCESVCARPESHPHASPEVVDVVQGQAPLVLHVHEAEEVLNRLRCLGVFPRQDKVKEHLVVDFTAVASALLEDTVYKLRGQCASVKPEKLIAADEAIFINLNATVTTSEVGEGGPMRVRLQKIGGDGGNDSLATPRPRVKSQA